MHRDVADRGVALVIGGGGGIGSAVTRALSEDGYEVVVTYSANRERAEGLVGELVGSGRPAALRALDATDSAQLDGAVRELAGGGRLTCLVHCVGRWTFTHLTELTDEEIDEILRLNLVSTLYALRAAGRHVADGGSVVTVSSAATDLAPKRQASYVAAKAGVEAASRVAAKELGARGVRVNVVRPGATDTGLLRSTTSPRAIEAMSTANVLRRLGTPGDVGEVVSFLCSDKARFVTGSVLDVAGGLR
ncbi:SDR family NAD(P)-dependent oxidoreductase [Georgenia sp. AZ-5]|uniref:SDR family NAD(P)-dependent oxidoreductase n=1 Tax=Georgenia sp. AZ-5 TaxID=3367526 RepID=UPI003754601D